MGDKIKTQISFFIPCFNEAENISNTVHNLIQTVKNLGSRFEILIYDDGSTDDTFLVMNKIKKNNPKTKIRLFRMGTNKGLGYVYQDAAKNANGEYFMLINGDGVETRSQIINILNHRGAADMIIPFFGKLDSRSIFRRKISLLFSFLVNFYSGIRIRYFNGAVLHKTKLISNLPFVVTGFGYQAEIIVYLVQRGATFKEVLVENSDREWGISKAFRPRNIFSVLQSINRIRKNKQFAQYKTITSWDRTKKVYVKNYEPANEVEVLSLLSILPIDTSISIRGTGKSYGDITFPKLDKTNFSAVLDTRRLKDVISLDEQSNILTVSSGYLIRDVNKYLSERNRHFTVQPGIDEITVGGAFASDVHGKNSFKVGNFRQHVTSIKAVDRLGNLLEVFPKNFAEYIFGVELLVLEVRLKVKLGGSKTVLVKRIKFNDSDELVSLLNYSYRTSNHMISWLDCFFDGKKNELGRGYLDIVLEENYSNTKKRSNNFRDLVIRKISKVIFVIIGLFYTKKMVKHVNKLIFMRQKSKVFRVDFNSWNFAHKKIPNSNLIHWPNGFIEIQPLIKINNAEKAIKIILVAMKTLNLQSELCGVKLHSASKNPTSPGFSNSMSISIGIDLRVPIFNKDSFYYRVSLLLKILNNLECSFYLTKDSILSSENVSNIFNTVNQKNLFPIRFTSSLYGRLSRNAI